MKKLLPFLTALLLTSMVAFAQNREVTGLITDADSGSPVPGANVTIKGTTTGTATDANGKFSLSVPAGTNSLTISFVGYATQEVSIPESNYVAVSLAAGSNELEEVVISVGRGAQRTITDTPLPVDVFSAKELTSTGQISFDKALQYRVPSFNTVQTPVNDATSLLDPYEIRNMGPSRTLILINGKRKNSSALVYTQTSPGRGETGADISAIPTDAIKRVEILRDGASAQYGSDAIAGVMNIILKDNKDEGSVTLRTGLTSKGDGEMIGISVNNGMNLSSKGFLNYTVDFSKVNLANRPGKVSNKGEFMDFGGTDPTDYNNYLTNDGKNLGATDISNFTPAQIDAAFVNYKTTPDYTTRNGAITQSNTDVLSSVDKFLATKPDAGNINGSPETTSAKFLVNGGVDINANSSIYFNAAYIYKKVNSFANYRTPYWRTLSDYPYLLDFFGDGSNPSSYNGYVPTFEGDLNDYNGTLGFKSNKNGWTTDLSLTVGGNSQTYSVRNSHNRNTANVRNPDTYLGDLDNDGVIDANEIVRGTFKYREASPVAFRAGGARFNHVVGNIDISKPLSDKISLSFGSEFRSETFETIVGDLASYEGGGADSFAGNSAENSFSSNRFNFGGYATLGFDITENFLIDATGRFENYSDFGNAFVYKLSSRYKFMDDKLTIRASFSTGFRAPSLHQVFTQKAQYSFVPGQGIQVSGLVNNVSREAKLLEVPKLDAEKSTNLTVGFGVNPSKNLSFTLDYYSIHVKDRIVLSNEIGPSKNPSQLNTILSNNGIGALSFFTNSISSITSGIDLVATYRNVDLGPGTLSFNLAGNYTINNKRDGSIVNPSIVENAGQSVLDDTQDALIFTSRPKFKAILGIDYTISKFTFSLNNTLFGPTQFRNSGMSSDLKIEFLTKTVTDLGISYQMTKKATIAFNVNNILNVLPEWKFVALNSDGESLLNSQSTNYAGLTPSQIQSNLITFNQRYSQMTYDGYHFSQLGTMFNLAVNMKF
jgi:iron complex outermembrane recepter protein